MKRLFRSRLPPPLTMAQKTSLVKLSRLSAEEIEEWYEHFNHCYPRGHLSYKEFLSYVQQVNSLNGNANRFTKPMVKQLFNVFNLNKHEKLSFEEFFPLNILVNQYSLEDKFRLMLNLYNKDKSQHLTQQQLESVLMNMFDILNISTSSNGLTERINKILNRANVNSYEAKISWEAFSAYVLNDPLILEFLISSDSDGHQFSEEFAFIRTRF